MRKDWISTDGEINEGRKEIKQKKAKEGRAKKEGRKYKG